MSKEDKEKAFAWLEKQCEQKTAHESKFKIGEWVIVHNKDAYQVIEVNEHDYRLRHFLGGEMPYPFTQESSLRLWAIQDAKDGDVLVTSNKNIFIFKEIKGATVYDYCGLYFNKFKKEPPTVNGTIATELPKDYVPATKEQRDLIFAKMKEAGYEWDSEKKELKKVGQNPAWSEEDEKMLKMIDKILFKASVNAGLGTIRCPYDDARDWLKSLRPQSRWKPSEDQLKALSYFITSNLPRYNESTSGWTEFDNIQSLYNDLKKLREE